MKLKKIKVGKLKTDKEEIYNYFKEKY